MWGWRRRVLLYYCRRKAMIIRDKNNAVAFINWWYQFLNASSETSTKCQLDLYDDFNNREFKLPRNLSYEDTWTGYWRILLLIVSYSYIIVQEIKKKFETIDYEAYWICNSMDYWLCGESLFLQCKALHWLWG